MKPHRDFRHLALLHPPLWRPLLPVINALLRLSPKPFGRGLQVQQRRISVDGGASIPAAVLTPEGSKTPLPCVIFFHGGAFLLKAAPQHYRIARELAMRTPCVVIMPDYRLAPRHPFPIPVRDCMAVYRFAYENAVSLGIDRDRIAVGGDSAGGNLAATVCLLARDSGMPIPRFQLLLYPVTDRRMETESMRAFEHTPMWNARLNRKAWQAYLPDTASLPFHYASLMESPSLAGLPDAYVEVAQLDPLRDEGIAYSQALREAGAQVSISQVEGAYHGYDIVTHSSIVQKCVQQRVEALQSVFAAEPERSGRDVQ